MEGLIHIIPHQCDLYPDFLTPAEGYSVLATLQEKAAWSKHTVRVFNQSFRSPRLSAWYGEPGAAYRYSGVTHYPLPWLHELAELKIRLEAFFKHSFNSVLLNYYRNGDDGMGAHSDDEAELGRQPVIASLSLGASRRFVFHPRPPNCGASIKLHLPHGSVLLMKGRCQRDWKHSLPKTKRAVGPRINLTFRWAEGAGG